ncbi:hypothetical protein FA95DRAFT_271704 [Auriscalpium vulgare]|uniref:Uncharacterized protein n=1 Tax=Auriscalpium vulgare TaxID=40419 RepID=A0ACB8S5M3_9AGAM|nr:hypothetical protein FA95DRAFT_271704 [Auriscalpium vulgare]
MNGFRSALGYLKRKMERSSINYAYCPAAVDGPASSNGRNKWRQRRLKRTNGSLLTTPALPQPPRPIADSGTYRRIRTAPRAAAPKPLSAPLVASIVFAASHRYLQIDASRFTGGTTVFRHGRYVASGGPSYARTDICSGAYQSEERVGVDRSDGRSNK